MVVKAVMRVTIPKPQLIITSKYRTPRHHHQLIKYSINQGTKYSLKKFGESLLLKAISNEDYSTEMGILSENYRWQFRPIFDLFRA